MAKLMKIVFFEFLRRQLFWFIDFLKGGKVYSHLIQLRADFKGNKKSSSKDLADLLVHASNTTEFYKSFQNCLLEDYPVVNKNIIRSKIDDFVSSKFGPEKRISVVTSGSTGTPFKVFHDHKKKNRNTADTIYFSELGGYKIGNRLFYLKIWAKEKLGSPLHYFIQNMVPFDVIKLSDHHIEKLLDSIQNYKGNISFLGYVSAWESVCRYLDKKNSKYQVASVCSVITMSESLDSYTKEKMFDYFGVKPLSRYSNLENGIIAQQTFFNDTKYLINTASYKVEIFDINEDKPIAPGKVGRIVVTDLYNYAMPMIRYDTGDFGVLSTETDQYGNMFLEKVEGRKLDVIFDTEGHMISSYLMYKNMWKYTDIEQYQIIQTGVGEYTFKISMIGKLDEVREKQLTNEFLEYLGKSAVFTIEYVDEIPLLDSGKRRKIVNLMINLK